MKTKSVPLFPGLGKAQPTCDSKVFAPAGAMSPPDVQGEEADVLVATVETQRLEVAMEHEVPVDGIGRGVGDLGHARFGRGEWLA
jgi:hypothetical protein